jgi:hypothetical protein
MLCYAIGARVFTCVAILLGVLCMAMPLSIVGSNFQEVRTIA